jgi:hypothetical protein
MGPSQRPPRCELGARRSPEAFELLLRSVAVSCGRPRCGRAAALSCCTCPRPTGPGHSSDRRDQVPSKIAVRSERSESRATWRPQAGALLMAILLGPRLERWEDGRSADLAQSAARSKRSKPGVRGRHRRLGRSWRAERPAHDSAARAGRSQPSSVPPGFRRCRQAHRSFPGTSCAQGCGPGPRRSPRPPGPAAACSGRVVCAPSA